MKSFVELVRFIFTIPRVEVFLSERISQDPLEKFFGCQRQRGHVNENPTVTEFCKNTQKLRVINSVCLDSVKGNCRGKNAQRHGKKRTDLCLGENIPSRATQNNCTTFYLLLHVCHLKRLIILIQLYTTISACKYGNAGIVVKDTIYRGSEHLYGTALRKKITLGTIVSHS